MLDHPFLPALYASFQVRHGKFILISPVVFALVNKVRKASKPWFLDYLEEFHFAVIPSFFMAECFNIIPIFLMTFLKLMHDSYADKNTHLPNN